MANLMMIAAFAAAASAASGEAGLKTAFGNTILSTYPDGRQAQLWLHPDGTYAAEGRRGDRSAGKWTAKGGKVCLKQSKPHAFPFSYCAPAPTGGIGTAWSGKAVTGEAIRIRLVRGMNARTAPPSQPGAKPAHSG